MNHTTTRIGAIAAIAGLALAASAAHAQEYAEVLSIQPRMVTTQQQQCHQVYVQGQNNTTAGTVIGGVVGGILGNQIGGGSGRAAATAAGVVGGAVLGNALGAQQEAPQQKTVCEMVPVTVQQGEIVTFRWRGKVFTHAFE